MLEQLGVNLYLIAAVIVIGVFVPLVAGFVLDGLVAIIRGRGLKPVGVAIGMTAAVAAIGFFGLEVERRARSWSPSA